MLIVNSIVNSRRLGKHSFYVYVRLYMKLPITKTQGIFTEELIIDLSNKTMILGGYLMNT